MKGANKDAISNSISYIESRLLENLDVNELAGQIYFSKTHYQRLFHSIVGEPVMEYVKKRRLQQACQTLCQTNATVLEIALEYGYETHEGFTRAFKALYGMPPKQFRKKHAPGLIQKILCREDLAMLSSEVTKGIAQHTRTIAEALAQFKNDLERLCASAEKTAIQEGTTGTGVITVLGELNSVAAMTGCLQESVKGFTGEGQTVYEVSDTIYALLKNVDDLAFQMHLLRFLSGIEVARTGIDAFDTYQNELTALNLGLLNHHGNFMGILKGLMSLLLADIRKESVRSIRSAVGLVRQTADKGKEMGIPNSAGFMQIAAEVEKRVAAVMEAAAVIDRYADTLEKGETSDRTVVDRAIGSLKDIAFTMNLTGFNATVETARSGAASDCADKIKGYAVQLHQTFASCTELFGETVKLSGLLVKSGEEYPDSIPQRFQKVLDDVLFQGGILAMQLGMESERAGLDAFKKHAKDAENAVALLSKSRQGEFGQDRNVFSDYFDAVSALTKSCHADAEANMPSGLTFAYIAREFDVFVEKMGAVMTMTKQGSLGGGGGCE